MVVDTAQLKRAARALRDAKRIVVLTGAGVSKESGVPTFRDAMDGLWARFNPEELATREAYSANPKLVWDWYEYRRDMVRGARPNEGHVALARLENRLPHVSVITQNVDNLHEQAGSRRVIRLHGAIMENKCFNDCQGRPTIVSTDTIPTTPDQTPPQCPHCGANLRPNVVWFGELLPVDQINAAYAEAESCDVMLVVGTSGMVNPAALLPDYARRFGATIIEVNPDETPISRFAHVRLQGPSGEMLPLLLAALDDIADDDADDEA